MTTYLSPSSSSPSPSTPFRFILLSTLMAWTLLQPGLSLHSPVPSIINQTSFFRHDERELSFQADARKRTIRFDHFGSPYEGFRNYRTRNYPSHSRFLMNPDATESPSTPIPKSKPIVFPTVTPIWPTNSASPPPAPTTSESPPVRSKVLIPDLDENGIPKCVKNPDDTFCEHVDTYPRLDLKSDYGINLEEFRDIFGEVKEIDARKSYFDDDSVDERICGGPRKIVFPKMAKTQSKRWVYIVNDDENFRQSVVTEICSRPGKPCAYLEDDNLPSGLSSQCRQKYARARLMALHPTEQRTYPEYFEFPSCCACYIKNPFSDRSKFRQ